MLVARAQFGVDLQRGMESPELVPGRVAAGVWGGLVPGGIDVYSGYLVSGTGMGPANRAILGAIEARVRARGAPSSSAWTPRSLQMLWRRSGALPA